MGEGGYVRLSRGTVPVAALLVISWVVIIVWLYFLI